MKKSLIYFFIVILSPLTVFAQSSVPVDTVGSSPSISLPSPITDFMNSLDKIKLDNSVIKLPDNIQGGEKLIGQRVISESQIGEWWNKINSWLMENLGVSFSEILRVIGNFIVWGFELVVKLLKVGLSYLPV
ncbi:MAG: hypothetical protein AB1333_01185 [Patescibacteria group bacterium]